MSVSWEDRGLTERLTQILGDSMVLDDDVADGAQVVLDESDALVPKESGRLSATGRVDKDRGGLNTVGVVYAGPYARYQHEHTWFKHPHGGQAKFLETAMLVKGQEAINRAGEHLWRRL